MDGDIRTGCADYRPSCRFHVTLAHCRWLAWPTLDASQTVIPQQAFESQPKPRQRRRPPTGAGQRAQAQYELVLAVTLCQGMVALGSHVGAGIYFLFIIGQQGCTFANLRNKLVMHVAHFRDSPVSSAMEIL